MAKPSRTTPTTPRRLQGAQPEGAEVGLERDPPSLALGGDGGAQEHQRRAGLGEVAQHADAVGGSGPHRRVDVVRSHTGPDDDDVQPGGDAA